MYYVYIMTNKNNTALYTGYTNNMWRRLNEHLSGHGAVFTYKYHVNKLVYFESFELSKDATAREKQIKAGSRKKKIDLINTLNPKWQDLAMQFK